MNPYSLLIMRIVVRTWPFLGLIVGAILGAFAGKAKRGAAIGFILQTVAVLAIVISFLMLMGGIR